MRTVRRYTPSMRSAPPPVGPGDPARPGRRAAFRGAALALPFAVLGAVEGVLRLADVADDPPAMTGPAIDLAAPELTVRDPELLWTFRPSAVLDVPSLGISGVRTNARGLRGPDVPDRREPGELRVVCIGDSVTFGLGLADDRTFPARLEAALRADPRLAGRTVRVLNAGVPGYSAVQGERLLRRLADVRPDVVVAWFGMNDAKPSLGRPDAQLRGDGATSGAAPGSSLRIVRVLSRALRSQPSTRVPPDDFRAANAGIAAAAGACGADLVVVSTPHRLRESLDELREAADRAAREGATTIVASDPYLSPYTPTPFPDERQLARTERAADGTLRLVLGRSDPRPTSGVSLREVEDRCALLRDWLAHVEALDAALGPDVLRAPELFGTVPPGEAMSDNCHLTERGAELAGAALARRCAEIAARRRQN